MNYNKFLVVNFISKWHVMYEILFKYTLKNLAQKLFFFVSILLIDDVNRTAILLLEFGCTQ